MTDGGFHAAHLSILAPAAGAVLTVLVVRSRWRRAAFAVMFCAGLLGLAAAVALAVGQGQRSAPEAIATLGELPLGQFRAPLQLRVLGWSALISVVAAAVSLVVQAFGRWYLYEDQRYRHFAVTVGVFSAAMQLVVLSDDLLLTVVGWEVMGWCSYLLIGHDAGRPAARRAAGKALLVTRAADAPFLLGVAALATGAGSTSTTEVVQAWSSPPLASSGWLWLALIGICCGVLGKSAQFPFQDWLPDAMEGPAPASALIHAATMVAAGTVVLASLLPLLQHSPPAQVTLLVCAGFSTVGAALLAFAQTDLKRLLAWSTISQVGLMLVVLTSLPPGTGPDLALFHLVGHAAFKALLFLLLGWFGVVVGGTVVPRLSGAVRRVEQGRTMAAIGLLALAGVPPTIGFASKDLIIDHAAQAAAGAGSLKSFAVLGILVLSTALTAAYAMRAWLILEHRAVFARRAWVTAQEDSHTVREVDIAELLAHAPEVDEFGQPTRPKAAVNQGPDDLDLDPEPSALAWAGLWVLAAGALLGGVLVVSPLLQIDLRHLNVLLIGATLLLMAAVAMAVRLMSLRTSFGDPAERLPLSVRSAAGRGLGVDRLYQSVVARPVLAAATGVTWLEARLDRAVDSLGGLVQGLSMELDEFQSRSPHHSVVTIAGGVFVVALLGVLLW